MTLWDFDDRAVLLLDGCSSHTRAQFREALARKNIAMRFLVPHTSHMTQALDVGIFWRCKNIIRTNSSYLINLQNLDRAVADEVAAANEGRDPSPKKGMKLAQFVLCILQAFHQATAGPLVVSAFEQVGICSRTCEGNNLRKREAFVDPTRARLVVAETGLFRDAEPVAIGRNRQLRIADLNSYFQRETPAHERQPAPRRALPPTPTSWFVSNSPPAPRVRPQAILPLLPVGFPSAFRPVQGFFQTAQN